MSPGDRPPDGPSCEAKPADELLAVLMRDEGGGQGLMDLLKPDDNLARFYMSMEAETAVLKGED